MGKEFFKKTTDLLQAKQKKKQWQKIVISLSLVVAMITSGLLIHPAITMERKAICGQEEHTHSAECYEKKLICDKEEHTASEVEEAAAKGETIEEHKHSDSCYKEELTCDKKEHKHSEDCYPKETEAKEETSQAKSTEETKTTEAPKAEEPTEASKEEKKADEAKEETTEEKQEEKAEARTLTAKGEDYTVQVDCPAEAKIPENAELKVREIVKEKEADKEEYEAYYKKAQEALKEKEGQETDISSVRFFDITFMVDGKEIEPAAKVEVKITYDKKVEVSDQGEVKSVHFGEEKTEILDTKTNKENEKMDEITFDATSFSVYGIVGTESTSEGVLTAEGNDYKITVTYTEEAKIPAGSKLEVKEFKKGTSEYKQYEEKISNILYAQGDTTVIDHSSEKHSVRFARIFDISILDKDGNEIEPKATVETKIEAAGTDEIKGDVNIMHFKDDADEPEMIPAKKDKNGDIVYQQDSFSVISFYDAPQVSADKAPTVLSAAEGEEDGPAHAKTLSDNGDGTYNITLSVTGRTSSSTTSSKADIVIVFDRSGSMDDYIASNTGSKGYYGWNGEFFQLYKKNGYGKDATYTEISDDENYSGKVYYKWYGRFYEYDGTRYLAQNRLSIAKSAVNSLAEQLLTKNNGNTDVETANVTLSLITFSTTASTKSFSNNSSTATLSAFTNAVNSITATGGTNWEAALNKANNITARDGATKYVIFVSDGNPTYRLTSHGNNEDEDGYNDVPQGVHGNGRNDDNGWNYSDAAAQAQLIGTNFYGVGVFGNVTNMQNLVSAAGATTDHYQSASDQTSLNAAFANIIKSITNSATFKNVKIKDHVTDLSAMSVVNGSVSDFTYTMNGETWENAPAAAFTESSDGTGKTVTWDLGDTTVENGVTYAVSFKVWPSQEAYDLVASLNNGTKQYSSLTSAQQKQIVKSGGNYYLQTNTGNNTLTYTKVDTTTDSAGNTTTTTTDGSSTFPDPEPGMALQSVKLKIIKAWNDDAYSDNRPSSITMQVTQDGVDYLDEIELNETNNWTKEIYIAPGIYVSPGTCGTSAEGEDAGVLEEGHTYTVKETDDYHYELSVDPTHPMLDGTTTNDSTDLINLLNKKVKYENGEVSITATNTLRGGIEIKKEAYANDGSTIISSNNGIKDTEFTFTLNTLTIPDGYTINSSDTTKKYIGDSYVKDSKFVVWYTKGETSGQIGEGDTFSLKPGETLRLTNIPVGTQYSVSESTSSGYELFQVQAVTNNGTKTVQTIDGKNVLVASGTTIGNTNYQYEFDNKLMSTSIVIKKTTEDYSTGLDGSRFTLAKKNASGTYEVVTGDYATLIPDATNGVKLENLEVGDYKLTETVAPAGYIVQVADTYFTVGIGTNGKGTITWTSGTTPNSHAKVDDNNTDTLLVGNKAGEALPNTGGSGTLPYTLGGLMLMSVAALMYGFIMRRRGRRLN